MTPDSVTSPTAWLHRLYALNAALLVAHEIDSAYWHEWEMFGQGGGVDGFVLLHIPLVLAMFWGFERLLAGARSGLFIALGLAAAGIGAGIIHSAFLLAGRPEFRCATSIGVLAAIVLASGTLVVLTVPAVRRRPTHKMTAQVRSSPTPHQAQD